MLKKIVICLLSLTVFCHLWTFDAHAQTNTTKKWVEMKYNHVMIYEKVDGKLLPYMILNSKQAYELQGSASQNWYKLKVEQKDVYVPKIRIKKAETKNIQSINISYKPTDASIKAIKETPVFASPSTKGKTVASLLKGMTYPVLFEHGDFYGIDIAGVKGFVAKSALVPPKEESPYATAVPVLMYHHLLRQAENQFSNNNVILNLENFEQQMKYLTDEGYTTIMDDELILFMKGELRLPKKSVLITFDDGHKTNYLYAYPILKQYNMHATAFIITNRIQPQPAEFDPTRLQFLSTQEMESMKDVFKFGSHTNGLHNLEGMTSQVLLKSPAELVADFTTSRDILQTSYFCYPFGQYTPETISLVKQTGYTAAFSTKEGYAEPNESLYEIQRFGVYPSTTMDEFKQIVSGLK
ncbi:peptidoglycan/xylan/chitin deacetylase (PgdA/CDA1 family) [Bacillus fengqiuensis]|nr:peptidoglycan/xylan/chitin deacetylase (PgdA/CDA1 family) [Bacillus fengqiuensis]